MDRTPFVTPARIGRMIARATLRLAGAREELSRAYETRDSYCLIPEAEGKVAMAEHQLAALQREFVRHCC